MGGGQTVFKKNCRPGGRKYTKTQKNGLGWGLTHPKEIKGAGATGRGPDVRGHQNILISIKGRKSG